jgi:GlpG protein
MRKAGAVPSEELGRRLMDYLVTLEIPAETRRDGGGWSVWVVHEDNLKRGKEEIESFLKNPDDPRYQAAARPAQRVRKELQREEREHRRNSIALGGRLNTIRPGRCPVVFTLLAGCIAVALLTDVGRNTAALLPFFFSPPIAEYHRIPVVDGVELPMISVIERSAGLEPIKQGQLWRLFTPMFIHYGWTHLIFNMMALYYFGGLIELRKGSLLLITLVLIAAPVSFLAQYAWDVEQHGPDQISLPGGMSGVIYALFGYVWMRGEYEPESALRISTSTISWMLVWLALCMTGFVGSIANAAHLSGLALGMGLGLGPYLWKSGPWR